MKHLVTNHSNKSKNRSPVRCDGDTLKIEKRVSQVKIEYPQIHVATRTSYPIPHNSLFWYSVAAFYRLPPPSILLSNSTLFLQLLHAASPLANAMRAQTLRRSWKSLLVSTYAPITSGITPPLQNVDACFERGIKGWLRGRQAAIANTGTCM